MKISKILFDRGESLSIGTLNNIVIIGVGIGALFHLRAIIIETEIHANGEPILLDLDFGCGLLEIKYYWKFNSWKYFRGYFNCLM